MTNKPRKVTRALLREHFASEEKWFTVDDMARALARVVAHDAAARVTNARRGLAGLSLQDKVHRGIRIMVVECLSHMLTDKQAEVEERDGGTFYRIRPVTLHRSTTGRVRAVGRASAFGVTERDVYDYVSAHPGCKVEEVFAALKGRVNVANARATVLKQINDNRAKNGTPLMADTELTDDMIRVWIVRRAVHGAKSDELVDRQTTVVLHPLPPERHRQRTRSNAKPKGKKAKAGRPAAPQASQAETPKQS